MESEESQQWKQYRGDQKERRSDRLPIRQAEIEALSSTYEVVKLTEYQYRINGLVDLYPIHNRYHHIKKNKRGGYANPLQIIKKLIPTP